MPIRALLSSKWTAAYVACGLTWFLLLHLCGCNETAPNTSAEGATGAASREPARSGLSEPSDNEAQSGDHGAVDQRTGDGVDHPPTRLAQANGKAITSPGEYWDASYIEGAKVGHSHTKITTVVEGERKLVRIEQDGHITVKRFGQSITQKMGFSSVESPAGELVRFDSTMQIGPAPATMKGQVNDRSLEATLSTFGKRTNKTLEWDPSWGGFFAAEFDLRRKPLKPGETRKLKALMPMATDLAIADVTLTAGDYETTKLLDGEQKLLKVTVNMKAGGPGDMEYFVWVDKHGESVKQFLPGMNLETYRVSRARALGEKDDGFDLGEFSTVKLDRGLFRAHEKKNIVYKVKLKGSNPSKVFTHGGSQQVKSLDDRTAQITVTAVRPNSPQELSVKPTPPTKGDLQPNNLIQSDDARVVELARDVSPRETDAWRLASDLERSVFEIMRAKNFSTAFATAAEVARSKEGDCTEHAVLLAAMCRARKIPARVAIGLVYYPPERGFAYHMWNEVWINDRWIPLDATLGRGGIGAAHLKLVDSNLAGASAYSTFLPVTKVLGQLEIEVLKAE